MELEGWASVSSRDGDVVSELNILVGRGVGDGDTVGWIEVIKDLIDDRARNQDVSDRVCGSKLMAADGMLL